MKTKLAIGLLGTILATVSTPGLAQQPANGKDFPYYGGPGITFYEGWLNDFQAFFEHVSPRPSAEHSLGRKDNDGPYAPANVEWQTRSQQANNTSANVFLKIGERRQTQTQWCREIGILRQKLDYRATVERRRINRLVDRLAPMIPLGNLSADDWRAALLIAALAPTRIIKTRRRRIDQAVLLPMLLTLATAAHQARRAVRLEAAF